MGPISYYRSSFFLFGLNKQSNCAGLLFNLFVFLKLCQNNSLTFLGLNSAVLSQVRNSVHLRLFFDSLSSHTQSNCVEVYRVWFPNQSTYFFLQKQISLPFHIYIPSTHIYSESLDMNCQTSLLNMLMRLWAQSLEFSLNQECLICVSIHNLLRPCSIISSKMMETAPSANSR